MLVCLFGVFCASAVNFTGLFLGSWNLSVSALDAESGQEDATPAQYRVQTRLGDESPDHPTSFHSEVFGQDADGIPQLQYAAVLGSSPDSNTTFAFQLAPIGEVGGEIEDAAALSFELGYDNMAVATGKTKGGFMFVANLVSASAIDATVHNPATKETWFLRMTKPTKKYQPGKWTILLPILPTLAIICFQRPKLKSDAQPKTK
jgi:hypothetical protein